MSHVDRVFEGSIPEIYDEYLVPLIFEQYADDLAQRTAPAVAYCQGTPLRNELKVLEPGGLDEATTHASNAIASYFGDGPVAGRIRAFVITAR